MCSGEVLLRRILSHTATVKRTLSAAPLRKHLMSMDVLGHHKFPSNVSCSQKSKQLLIAWQT